MTHATDTQHDVIIVGAGFAGLYALHVLRGRGYRTTVLEAGDGIGGTWYWNRYPGARCDVESIDYSYTFSEELYRAWTWSERYAQQPEIESYLNWVADRLNLCDHIELGVRVVAAAWDDANHLWTVEVDDGARRTASFVVAATGCLSVPHWPDLAGLDTFAGTVVHTATWPRDGVDVAGRRVAVIGTGSSGIQVIPPVAEVASHLVVFQRTANYTLPAGQTLADPDVVAARKRELSGWRGRAWQSEAGFDFPPPPLSLTTMSPEEAYAELDRRWAGGGFAEIVRAFENVFTDPAANQFLSEYFRHKVRQVVHDPTTAELLSPRDHPIGSKRVCADTGYYETFNREHVEVVDTRTASIDHFDRDGCVLADGRRFDLDLVILATGFDAMTGALHRIDIVGRDGRRLTDAWADGPHTYLGLQVAGFPNLFTITGPQSPSVLNNMVLGIEHHVGWIADCLDHLTARGARSIEPTERAQVAWGAETELAAADTLFPQARSWYGGGNIPGKPQVFMVYVGGFGNYVERCAAVAATGYVGFALDEPT